MESERAACFRVLVSSFEDADELMMNEGSWTTGSSSNGRLYCNAKDDRQESRLISRSRVVQEKDQGSKAEDDDGNGSAISHDKRPR